MYTQRLHIHLMYTCMPEYITASTVYTHIGCLQYIQTVVSAKRHIIFLKQIQTEK